MKILYVWEVGDKVKLPFDETGTIVKILDIIWGFRYVVRIRKSNGFNKTNQRMDFRYEDLNPE
jgi:hypothetical protein